MSARSSAHDHHRARAAETVAKDGWKKKTNRCFLPPDKGPPNFPLLICAQIKRPSGGETARGGWLRKLERESAKERRRRRRRHASNHPSRQSVRWSDKAKERYIIRDPNTRARKNQTLEEKRKRGKEEKRKRGKEEKRKRGKEEKRKRGKVPRKCAQKYMKWAGHGWCFSLF